VDLVTKAFFWPARYDGGGTARSLSLVAIRNGNPCLFSTLYCHVAALLAMTKYMFVIAAALSHTLVMTGRGHVLATGRVPTLVIANPPVPVIGNGVKQSRRIQVPDCRVATLLAKDDEYGRVAHPAGVIKACSSGP
jgi:hypothetical protein